MLYNIITEEEETAMEFTTSRMISKPKVFFIRKNEAT